MPEGDTIRSLCGYLGPALSGRRLARVRVHLRRDLGGDLIRGISHKGTHLESEGGLCLRSHLGLYGSWHRYRPQEPRQRPGRQATLVLELEDWASVCFNATARGLTRTTGFDTRDQRRRLGPDLSRESPEPEPLRTRAFRITRSSTPPPSACCGAIWWAIPDGRGSLWAYVRAGLSCLICGKPEKRDRLGRNPRSTYGCPGRQGPAPQARPAGPALEGEP